MKLEIVTPDERIYSGEIKLIQVPGTNGSFEILKNHAPIISTLGKGKVKVIEEDNSEKYFDIQKGVIELNKDKIILLVEKV